MKWRMPSLRQIRSAFVVGLALVGFFLATPRHAWAQG